MLEQRKVVTATPENSETPWRTVRSWVTPNPPVLRPQSLRAAGHRPERLAAAGGRLCAAAAASGRGTSWPRCRNGRSLPPWNVPATGGPSCRRTSTACPGGGRDRPRRVTGVPLRVVLERAGVQPGAVEVLFTGADRGSEADHPEPMPFAPQPSPREGPRSRHAAGCAHERRPARTVATGSPSGCLCRVGTASPL